MLMPWSKEKREKAMQEMLVTIQQLQAELRVKHGEIHNESFVLKSLINFAIDKEIPHFKYKDFEFVLNRPNPNQEELNALKEEVAKLKVIVNQLTFKEKMAVPNVFNRAENLAARLGAK